MKNLVQSIYMMLGFIMLVSMSAHAQISFSSDTVIHVGADIKTVKIADMNGDKYREIIFVSDFVGPDSEENYRVGIYYQQNTKQPVTYYLKPRLSADVRTMDIGDINNDRLPDIVVGYGDSIGLFINRGNQLFNFMSYYSGTTVDGVKIADLNGDNLLDIAVCHWNSDFIRMFYHQISTKSLISQTYAIPHGGYDKIDVGDVNNDGLNDIVFLRGQGEGPYMYVILQIGGGKFATAIPLSKRPRTFTIGDCNTDGIQDIITCNQEDQNAHINIFMGPVYSNLGSGYGYFAYEYAPDYVLAQDLDGDKKIEIITSHGQDGSISVYQKSKDKIMERVMKTQLTSKSGSRSRDFDIGDINGDNQPDIVLADSKGVLVLYNTSQTK